MQNSERWTRLLLGVSALCSPSLLAASPAQAQNTSTAASSLGTGVTDGAQGQGDIVVTAQKRAERLIDVPIPVTTISSAALTSQGLVKLSDFYNRIPGLQFQGETTSQVSIRGINTGGGTNPTVAFLVDDIPFSGTTNLGQSPIPDFDPTILERVEVLRGPQGTLYGASSLGGLIKYVTQDPSTTRWSGRLEAGADTVAGGDGGYSGRGAVNIPVVNDLIGLSLSGFYRSDPAWLDNIYPTAAGKNVNKRRTFGGRGALIVKPTNRLTLTLSAIGQKVDSENSDQSTSGLIRVCAECQTAESTAQVSFKPILGNYYTVDSSPSQDYTTFQLYSIRAKYSLDWATLTSITGWSRSDEILDSDVTTTFGKLFSRVYGAPSASNVRIANGNDTHKFSQEMRLGSTGHTIDWLAGGFYTVEHANIQQTLTLLNSGATLATPYIGSGPTSYKEYAAYGDITYHATDKLNIQVGGRYAHNKQTSISTLVIDNTATAVFGPSSTISAPSKDSSFTWLFSPSYHFTRDIMGYVRIASGYRPGGPNTGFSGVRKSYDADTVVNYELGLKGNIIPSRLTADISVFQVDWKDIQLQDTDAISQLTYTTNGGRARSRGVEFATTFTPFNGFSIDGNAAYTDATLRDTLPESDSATGLIGSKGDRLPGSAKFTANLTAQEAYHLNAKLDGFVGVTYSYIGSRKSEFNSSDSSATLPRYDLPSYTLVELDAGLTFEKSWELRVYVRNLLNHEGVVFSSDRNGTSTPTALFTQPRTVGFTLARNF